jgi:hypothetical protein
VIDCTRVDKVKSEFLLKAVARGLGHHDLPDRGKGIPCRCMPEWRLSGDPAQFV